MTSDTQKKPQPGRAIAAALLFAPLFAASSLGGCATTDTRPTTPTYSGDPRAEASRPPRPGAPAPRAGGIFGALGFGRGGFVPRHMARETGEIKRIAVLLPFSSTDPEVKKLTRALYNAVQLAVFDAGADNIVLLPRDTSGEPQQAAQTAQQSVKDGAVAVVGPLFAQHVAPVADAARGSAPVFAFSTDVSVLGQGAYLMSLTPRTEVQRIVKWASDQGVTRFAMLGPDNAYGRAVAAALKEQTTAVNGVMVAAEFYQPGDNAPIAPAKRLAAVVKAESKNAPGKVAVLIPERGVQLRTVAPLLPYFDVNVHQVKFLGTTAWNDPEVWREPSLFGGAFPAPDPQSVAEFEKRYQAAYGELPPKLASYGYDAGAIASALAKANQLNSQTLQRPEGFVGVNGLFRFGADGGVERGLAVLAVSENGTARVISPPIASFLAGS